MMPRRRHPGTREAVASLGMRHHRGRFAWRWRPGGMSEADCARLITAAHRALKAPVIVIWTTQPLGEAELLEARVLASGRLKTARPASYAQRRGAVPASGTAPRSFAQV